MEAKTITVAAVAKARFFCRVTCGVFFLLASGVELVSATTSDSSVCPTELAACGADAECAACFTELETAGCENDDTVGSCTNAGDFICCVFDDDCVQNALLLAYNE